MPVFNLKVEGDFDPNKATEVPKPKLELKELVWHGDSPPDIIILSNDVMLVKVSRYLMAGNNYCYRSATIAKLEKGQLAEIVIET